MEWWTAAFRGATRTESDALGPIGDVLWGAQTQRYLQTVPISGPDVVMMPEPVTKAFGTLKKCTAEFNMASGELDANIGEAIVKAADEMISGELLAHFPIGVFQTGKGAQTNMCVNEVISNRAIQILGGKVGSKVPVHPNEHVDMGQSSDDSLSIAISIAVVCEIHDVLFPGLLEMHSALAMKSTEFTRAVAEEEQIVAEEARSVAEVARSVEKRAPTVAEGAPEGSMRPPLSAITTKIGCTQQQDSSLLTLGHRLGCYALQLLRGIRRVEAVLPRLSELALGNTALDKDLDDSIWCGVGGMVDGYSDGYSSDLEDIVEGSAQEKRRRVEHLHAGSKPACSAREIAARIAIETGLPFTPAPNEVDGGITDLAAHDALIEASSALSDLAQSLDQIANDLRYFSTVLPHLDMPIQCEATVLPHLDMPIQCEALQLACVQVLCNHAAIASSSKPQSDDEFDIFEPAMVSNLLSSIRVLGDASHRFATSCVVEIRQPDRDEIPTPAPFAEPSRSLFFSGAVVTAVCSAIEWVRRVRQVIKRVRRVRHWSDSSGGSANQSAETFVESVTADQFAVWRDGGRPSPEPPMRRYGGQHSRQTSACGKSVCSPR